MFGELYLHCNYLFVFFFFVDGYLKHHVAVRTPLLLSGSYSLGEFEGTNCRPVFADVALNTAVVTVCRKMLVVGGDDGRIRLLDPRLRSTSVEHVLKAHTGPVQALAVTPTDGVKVCFVFSRQFLFLCRPGCLINVSVALAPSSHPAALQKTKAQAWLAPPAVRVPSYQATRGYRQQRVKVNELTTERKITRKGAMHRGQARRTKGKSLFESRRARMRKQTALGGGAHEVDGRNDLRKQSATCHPSKSVRRRPDPTGPNPPPPPQFQTVILPQRSSKMVPRPAPTQDGPPTLRIFSFARSYP